MQLIFKSLFLVNLCIVTILGLNVAVFAQDKLKVNEIVEKHLDAIGTKEKRNEIMDQLILASVKFEKKGATTYFSGKSVFASTRDKNLFGMELNSNEYPQEKFSFDGNKVRVSFSTAGLYSMLGKTLFNNPGLIKNGLLGGTLNSSWLLNNFASKRPKLSLIGSKTNDNYDAYVIEYIPKGDLDFEIKIFIDKKTFNHVRTEYFRSVAARQSNSIDTSARQGADNLQIIEEFSNFTNMDGLNLPSKYSLNYNYYNNSISTSIGSVDVKWSFEVTNFKYNQKFDDSIFIIPTK